VTFVEANQAGEPAYRLIDEDNRIVNGARRNFAGLTRPGREGIRDAFRRGPQKASLAIGP
jgi:hypothetical protein